MVRALLIDGVEISKRKLAERGLEHIEERRWEGPKASPKCTGARKEHRVKGERKANHDHHDKDPESEGLGQHPPDDLRRKNVHPVVNVRMG